MVAQPHGGGLIDRIRSPPSDADELPVISLDSSQYMDLEMIATGGYSPLQGFMTRDDYSSVLDEMRLASGEPWSIPVVLTSDDEPSRERHALVFKDKVVGSIDVDETWRYSKDEWCDAVFTTNEIDHPGVKRVRSLGEYAIGGEIDLFQRQPEKDFELRYTPRESRKKFQENGWRTIVGFQTRNPPHRAHEYLQKCALEVVDGIFLHPLVGNTKPGDVRPGVRMEAYRVLENDYHVSDRVLLGTLKVAMRYAGPREGLFHAIIRQNYGCTHFIMGRDHAGVKDYYGSYEAHELVRGFEDELGINLFYFDYAFYCHKCDSMATKKTCSHDDRHRENPSGTMIRRAARNGEFISEKIMRPEIWDIVHTELNGDAESDQSKEEAETGGVH